jgi:hypothetical protein
VHVAGSELGGEAVALLVEDEERMVADGLKVTVVRRLLLRPVDGTLGAVDIERYPLVRGTGRRVLGQCRVETNESLIVLFLP